MLRSRQFLLALPLALVTLAAGAAAQDHAAPPRGSREAAWPAPTAEDWKKPCLIHWQRTWDDALAVSKETGKPILVCVNMDGEIASEHYAGITYREAETAALYNQYTCVVASVYRHNARDYDEQGRRIPCPRFGTVTCGEHIAIEPVLYSQYFDGQRVAPRHVGVESDGKESYDVYYALDTATVFDAVKQGLAGRPPLPPPPVHGEGTPLDLIVSRDSTDREAVEAAYQNGDADTRRTLLAAAAARGPDVPLDVVRLALHDSDPSLAGAARAALSQSGSPVAVDLIVHELGFSIESPDRAALLAALDRLGETTPRARTLAVAYHGLAGPSTTVDLDAWSRALVDAPPAPSAAVTQATRLEHQNEVLDGKDAGAHVELAEALLAQAHAEPDAKLAQYLDRDAQHAAQEAERLGAYGSRLATALALTSYDLGDLDAAESHAEAALSTIPKDPRSRDALVLLTLFAQSRQEAIAKAVKEKTDWPASWLADVHAAWAAVARHPLANDSQVLMHYDFLQWFGATAEAGRVLDDGLSRFPASWNLHDRLRARVLSAQGVAGLEPEYARRLAAPDAPPALESFAGYAALVAAEYERRSGDSQDALDSYDRGIAHYERAVSRDAGLRDDADKYVALALAGRARVDLELGNDARAVDELLASFARKPAEAATLDGLNISAVDTASMLLARLGPGSGGELAVKLQAGLAKLDPELLLPPAYERGEPGESSVPRRSGPRAEPATPKNP